MVGGETLLIALITGTLGHISQNNQLENIQVCMHKCLSSPNIDSLIVFSVKNNQVSPL